MYTDNNNRIISVLVWMGIFVLVLIAIMIVVG